MGNLHERIDDLTEYRKLLNNINSEVNALYTGRGIDIDAKIHDGLLSIADRLKSVKSIVDNDLIEAYEDYLSCEDLKEEQAAQTLS